MQVVWLDVAAARARFGEWIEGALPSFLKHPTRGKLSARARRKGPKGRDTGEDSGVDAEGVVRDATGQLLSVRMQQLRYRWSVACVGGMLQGYSASAGAAPRQPQTQCSLQGRAQARDKPAGEHPKCTVASLSACDGFPCRVLSSVLCNLASAIS